jgi:hypothetical protein
LSSDIVFDAFLLISGKSLIIFIFAFFCSFWCCVEIMHVPQPILANRAAIILLSSYLNAVSEHAGLEMSSLLFPI